VEYRWRIISIITVTLIVMFVLLLFTLTDLNLDLAWSLRLQRPGLYPVADVEGNIDYIAGWPYVPQYPVLFLYFIFCIIGGSWLIRKKKNTIRISSFWPVLFLSAFPPWSARSQTSHLFLGHSWFWSPPRAPLSNVNVIIIDPAVMIVELAGIALLIFLAGKVKRKLSRY